ncbi:MAG: hypothetical protein WBA45_17220 [Microthrixaceae bacterium]
MAFLGRAAFTLVVVGAAVLVWLVGTATEADALTCGPATATRAAVAVVVDFGDSTPDGSCASIPRNSSGGTNSTGIDALKTAGHSLRIDGGFLCAIDGVPATGCARNSGFDGWYWRYFKAEPGKGWRYSSSGFGYRMALVNGCGAEGWVWSDSPDASVAPRGGVPSLNCTAQPTPTTTRVPVTSAPLPPQTSPNVGGASGSAGAGSGVAGAGVVGTGAAGSGAVGGPGGVDGTGQPDGSTATAPAAGAGSPAGAGTDIGPDGSASGNDAAASGAAGDQAAEQGGGSNRSADGPESSIDSSEQAEAARSTRRANRDSAGPGSMAGSIIAGLLVAGLVVFVALRARSRRATEQA